MTVDIVDIGFVVFMVFALGLAAGIGFNRRQERPLLRLLVSTLRDVQYAERLGHHLPRELSGRISALVGRPGAHSS